MIEVKYFTAPVKAKLSRHGIESCKLQEDYWIALAAGSTQLRIIKGSHFITQGSLPADEHPFDLSRTHRVMRAEEKQTDVNIAINMVLDAVDGSCEQQLLISNDSDCAPILSTIRERFPDMRLGVVAPISKEQSTNRKPSKDLLSYAHWSRRSISELELLRYQLPDSVKTRKRSVRRPQRWGGKID